MLKNGIEQPTIEVIQEACKQLSAQIYKFRDEHHDADNDVDDCTYPNIPWYADTILGHMDTLLTIVTKLAERVDHYEGITDHIAEVVSRDLEYISLEDTSY